MSYPRLVCGRIRCPGLFCTEFCSSIALGGDQLTSARQQGCFQPGHARSQSFCPSRKKKKSPKPLQIRPLSAHLAPEFPVCILTVCLGFMGLHIPGGRETPEDTCVYKPAMKAFLFWQSIMKLRMRKDRRQKLRPSVENCNSESSWI